MTRRALPPIPPFRRARDIYARASQLLRPRASMTVSAWARIHMGYEDDVLPWQPAIMDALGAPGGGDVDLMGPAQAGKSEIGLAWWGWSIDHSPADFLICQPDKTMMQDFVIRRIDPLIARVKVLRDALLDKAGSDNIFAKRFTGMISAHIWPVAAQFRARPVPRGWLDDFDQIADDIEGQGNAHTLMAGRQTWFEGRARTFSSSSPARPDGGGIEARVRSGSDERLWPQCPACGERWEINLERDLRFDRAAGEAEAAASAHVVCGANGCVLQPKARRQLLDSCRTLPERGFIAANPGARRRSFAVDGLMNVVSWSDLARAWRAAEIAWETRQDESELRAFVNTKAGRNYRSRLQAARKIEAEYLAPRLAAGLPMGVVPPSAKVVVMAIDVQGNRFEGIAVAYGAQAESWIVDRFDIHVVPGTTTLIEPALYPEHWQVLTPLLQRRYPLAGSDATVPVLTVAVDTGGEAGVSENAVKWYRSVRALGIDKERVTLVKGGSNYREPRAVKATFLDAKRLGGVQKRGVRLWMLNTHMLKSVIDARLRRPAPGPGYVHLPRDFEAAWLDELTAEEFRPDGKGSGRWVKLRPRNETLDLVAYAYGALIRPPFAQTRSDYDWVPKAFRVPDLPGEGAAGPAAVPSETAPLPRTPRHAPSAIRSRPHRARVGWMGRL